MIRALVLSTVVVVMACSSEALPESVAPTVVVEPSATPTPSPTPSDPPLSYTLSCGELEPAYCRIMAAEVVADAEKQYPRKTVVSLAFSGLKGDFHLLFDDGITMMRIVD